MTENKKNKKLKQMLTFKPLRPILNLEHKLSSLAFFAVHKISIIFNRRLKHKYEIFNAWQQQKCIHIKFTAKTVSLLNYS